MNDVDIPAPDTYFHESCQKKFYASHSNFQHIKEIVSESDETDFSRKSDEIDLSRKFATHGYAYSSAVQILKERKLFLLLKLIENF